MYMTIFAIIINISVVIGATKLSDEKSSQACGGIFLEDRYFLTSGNSFSKNNLTNPNCTYNLSGVSCPTFYQFDFLEFNLDNDANCGKEAVLVGDEYVLCGFKNGTEKYFAVNGTLLVKYLTGDIIKRNGFNISVTRLPCEKRARTDTDIDDMEQTTTEATVGTTLPFKPFIIPIPPSPAEPSACCFGKFNARKFTLTSPDFPYSLNRKRECSYRIEKANNNICRLRMNFLFFWLGQADSTKCPYGFLDVGGKRVCGCNQELKLATTFDDTNYKILQFKSEGVNLNSQTGFVIEVIQDDCPLKYHPMFKNNSLGNLHHYNSGQRNPINWSYDNRQFGLPSSNYFQNGDTPSIFKSFYYFVEPDYTVIPPNPNDLEEPTYVDTDTLSMLIISTNHYECTIWNQKQMNKLNQRYGTQLQTCSSKKEDIDTRNCVELDYLRGVFSSPGYPCYYPANLRICYRFKKQAGYCAFRIFMNDFQVENSYACFKDHLLIGNRKYCGTSLYGQTVTLDLTNRGYVDLQFVTDWFKCGRGFAGVYEQLPCRTPDYPTTRPPFPTTTPTVRPGCDRYIRERTFMIEANQNHDKCVFDIQKYSQDVCKIKLTFDEFDLNCATETLYVGNRIYCGDLTGRTISINIISKSRVEILYKNTNKSIYGDVKFRIRGEQITDDCIFNQPTVTPARLGLEVDKLEPMDLEIREVNRNLTSPLIIKMKNKNFKEICAVVKKYAHVQPYKICEVLRDQNRASHCEVLKNKIPYITGEPQIMELNLDDYGNHTEEIEYEEIDCEHLSYL